MESLVLPTEVDSPESLMPDLIELRNEALRQNDFQYAVHLSHVIKWMNWLIDNLKKIREANLVS